MRELIEALLRACVTTEHEARLVEAGLIEAGARHAQVDLSRLREILRLVRLVIGPYPEEEKAEAKAALDELAALTGAPPAEGESMVERAARAAIMKAHSATEMQGEGANLPQSPPQTPPPEPPKAPEAQPQPAPAVPEPAATPAPKPAPAPEPEPAGEPKGAAKVKAKAAAEAATGRTVTVKIAESALVEMIRHEGEKWIVYSHDGSKKLGEYDSEKEAKERLGQIEAAKHAKASVVESCLIEAIEPEGKLWDVLVLRSGTSKNRRRYRSAVLREAVERGVMEGAKSYADGISDHVIEADGRRRATVRTLVGWWDGFRFGTFPLPKGGQAEGVAAKYHVTDPTFRTTLREAWDSGRPDLIGYSIYGDGPLARVVDADGLPALDVGRIDVVESIDPVMHPAAGGQALRLVASEEPMHTCPTCGAQYEGAHTCTSDVSKIVEAQVEKALAPIRTAQLVEAALAAVPQLAEPARARVRVLAESQALDADGARKLVEAEAEYVAKLNPAPAGGSGVIVPGQDQRAKLVEMVDDVLTGKTHSLRKVYLDLTGDEGFTGRVQDSGRLVESRLIESAIVSTTFPKLTQEAFGKKLMADYKVASDLTDWRKVVSAIGPAADFRAVKRLWMGGYGDLPAVNEAAAYQPLAEPSETEVTVPAVTKKGGTEDLTLEAVANDDVSAFRRIPTKLARAANRTLDKGVWAVFTSNMTYTGDTKALFHADHGNLGSAALDGTSLEVARLAMAAQAEPDSSEKLGIRPRYLLIPEAMRKATWVLLNTERNPGSAEWDRNFAAQMGLADPIVVPYWTDANNWYLAGDPTLWDTLEVRFFGGREEPELFIQDEPRYGASFTNDVAITYKIRHIWGIGLLDYRPFYGAVVVG